MVPLPAWGRQPVLSLMRSDFPLWGVFPMSDKLRLGVLVSGSGTNLQAIIDASLTGKIDADTKFDSADFRNVVPRFTREARAANQALVDLLRAIAERKGATPAQIALAWLLALKPWIVPIPGTTKLSRVEENIGAAAIELTPGDLREIEGAASKITIEGARYPEALEAKTGL